MAIIECVAMVTDAGITPGFRMLVQDFQGLGSKHQPVGQKDEVFAPHLFRAELEVFGSGFASGVMVTDAGILKAFQAIERVSGLVAIGDDQFKVLTFLIENVVHRLLGKLAPVPGGEANAKVGCLEAHILNSIKIGYVFQA
jgi:hypothetical protein